MARRKKQPTSTVSGAKTHFQGLGYFIPHGYTLEQIQKLSSDWNQKLQKSGHKDCEAFSDVLPGLSSPFLYNSRSPEALQSHHNPITALNLIRTYINYYMHTKEARAKYSQDYKASLFLLECYLNQVDFRAISKLKSTGDLESFKEKYPELELPYSFTTEDLKTSHYWAYQTTRKLLQHCWLWHITDHNGELTADDLTTYGFVGLDVKGTTQYYNNELAKLGKPPIKLRKPESKY
jgi:hypothetical protein